MIQVPKKSFTARKDSYLFNWRNDYGRISSSSPGTGETIENQRAAQTSQISNTPPPAPACGSTPAPSLPGFRSSSPPNPPAMPPPPTNPTKTSIAVIEELQSSAKDPPGASASASLQEEFRVVLQNGLREDMRVALLMLSLANRCFDFEQIIPELVTIDKGAQKRGEGGDKEQQQQQQQILYSCSKQGGALSDEKSIWDRRGPNKAANVPVEIWDEAQVLQQVQWGALCSRMPESRRGGK